MSLTRGQEMLHCEMLTAALHPIGRATSYEHNDASVRRPLPFRHLPMSLISGWVLSFTLGCTLRIPGLLKGAIALMASNLSISGFRTALRSKSSPTAGLGFACWQVSPVFCGVGQFVPYASPFPASVTVLIAPFCLVAAHGHFFSAIYTGLGPASHCWSLHPFPWDLCPFTHFNSPELSETVVMIECPLCLMSGRHRAQAH